MSTKLQKEVVSYWRETGKAKSYEKLQENIKVDIAIVGGGIAGTLTAYNLAKEGKKVALLEARDLFSGTTGYTTAKLTAQHNLIYDELINRYGQEAAKLYYRANMEGIATIKELAKENNIDCELEEKDAFVFTEKAKHRDAIQKEAKAYEKLGIEGEFIESLPLNLDIEVAIMMRNQAQFHPVKFLQSMVKLIKQYEGEVFENTRVMDIKEEKKGVICKTDSSYTVTAKEVVVATHFPVYETEDKFYSNNLSTESSYALAIKSNQEFPDGMYINTDLPKRTMRGIFNEKENYILVGGESHPTGDGKSSEERYNELVRFAEKHFGDIEVVNHWSSHDYISSDRIPFVGKLHEDLTHMYTLTGFSKWGLAASVSGAKVIADLILGRENPYQELFSPQRNMAAIKEEGAEEKNPIDQYKDASQAKTYEELGKGEGSIVEMDGKNVGAYRDNEGKIHLLDTSCTHLGCDVAWNDGDHTWDCPCHGSRFSATGEVVEGPAVEDLKKINK
ncbi:FAD-dependent oxidoreductase [Virgibacillus halodenitrificans]|uniref:FAD-dependent oxidoreductase n=1 Tax=Virgibacillus halodenitrificans TaxID=1482 RepID=UPI001F3F8A43|nr:FAD-dependent oxidoreductase [Virgibacillus halodenitrificans]